MLGFMCFGWLNPANSNPLPNFVAQSQQSIAPEIFQHCRFTGQRCLQHVDRFLLAADPGSIYWYELMLLKLDSLFILQRDAQLYALTSKLVLK
ncbi:MAG: hypothetical protein KKB00_12700, partial [Gammaproteobacteria bacterium]|nr:hypothetical protein [Gammaproteobacteria bacterium]